MSNPSHNLLKIGKTDRDPNVRRQELDSMGVPEAFKLVYYAFIEDQHQLEKSVYQELNQYRPNKDREFFDISIDVAVEKIRSLASSSIKYEEKNFESKVNQERFERFYDDGQLKQTGFVKDGMANSIWESYYKNGRLEIKANYKDDRLDGVWESYYENGQLESKREFYYEKGQLKVKSYL